MTQRRNKTEEMLRRTANIRESVGANLVHPPAPQAGAQPATIAGNFGDGARDMDELRKRIVARDSAVIPLDKLAPDPEQPRKEFDPDALDRLAQSLKTVGQLQTCLVRWDRDERRYWIIAGERRWRAAGIAGLPTLQCIVVNRKLSEEEIRDIQLIENCVREGLTPMERARAFLARIERTHCSVRSLAAHLSLSPSTVSAALKLLKLPPELQAQVEAGDIAPATAIEIDRLPAEARPAAVKAAAAGEPRAKTRARRPPTTSEARAAGATSEPAGQGGVQPLHTPGARDDKFVSGPGELLYEPAGQGGVQPLHTPGPRRLVIDVPSESGRAMEYDVAGARVLVIIGPEADPDLDHVDALQRCIRLALDGKGRPLT